MIQGMATSASLALSISIAYLWERAVATVMVIKMAKAFPKDLKFSAVTSTVGTCRVRDHSE